MKAAKRNTKPTKPTKGKGRKALPRRPKIVLPEERMADCPGHKEAREVYAWPLHVFAGSQMSKTPVPQGATVVDLAGGLQPTIRANFTIPGLGARYVRIEWPDMQVPNLTADDWKRLAKGLSRERKVYIACAGGHGRTGTALAILGHFWGCLPKGMDPVDYLRKVYDGHAVETKGQAAYITAMTGREVSLDRAWKAPQAPQSNVPARAYTVGKDGTVQSVRERHGELYQGRYFGGGGSEPVVKSFPGTNYRSTEDRSWTLGQEKKIDKGKAACESCGATTDGHFSFCAMKG